MFNTGACEFYFYLCLYWGGGGGANFYPKYGQAPPPLKKNNRHSSKHQNPNPLGGVGTLKTSIHFVYMNEYRGSNFLE